MAFARGTKVVGANDTSPNPKVGTVVELVERKSLQSINEGEFDAIEIYRVRWRMPNGPAVEEDVPADALKALPSSGRHGGAAPDSD